MNWLMNWLGRTRKERPVVPQLAPVGPIRAPMAEPHHRMGQTAFKSSTPLHAIPEAKSGETPIKAFGDLPQYLGVLTEGERAIYQLNQAEMACVVALELTGRKVLILATDQLQGTQALIESMRGSFIGNGYSVMAVRTAPSGVIHEVYAACTSATSGLNGQRAANQYMAATRTWIEYAVTNRATDIHIETRGSSGQVRFRIDGEVETMRTENRGIYGAPFLEKCMGALFNEQMKRSGSDSLFDQSKNVYCMVSYDEIAGHPLKLRFQSIRGNEGPKVVLRLLPQYDNAHTLTFEVLGYAPSHIKLWHMAMDTPSGACFIAGVTGSGKSTTQKSLIELNPNSPNRAIYTLEEPVEYPIKFTHQIPIQSEQSYQEIFTAILRLDPDVVGLGEIRDFHSASAYRQITESGHMALGTVHAHLLSGIVPRLVNPQVGMHRELLTAPNMLTLLVYQALVPKVCPHCGLSTQDAEGRFDDVVRVANHLRDLDLKVDGMHWKRPEGCAHCAGRGTVGQTVVAEMLMPDDDWLQAIRAGLDAKAVEIYRSASDHDLTSPNMNGKTVFEHTLFKALQGEVDARQCGRFDNFDRFVKRYKRIKR